MKDIMRTSAEWAEKYKDEFEILDPDGWDRRNFQHSFYEEKISDKEFNKRVGSSTVQLLRGFFK